MASASVCLIIPPSGFLLDERVFPSLGVLKVAAALEQADVSVQVLDLSGIAVMNEAGFPAADVYGITATTPQMPAAIVLLGMLRVVAPDARVILGGPHATLVQASARAEQVKLHAGRANAMLRELLSLFDVVIAGDGERAMLDAIRTGVHGLIDADDPSSPLWLTKTDLTDAPLPARHLINLSSYHYTIDGCRATSLIAQLGCPFGCNFCGGRRSPFLRRVRLRSTRSIVDEVETLYLRYGYTGFMFFDDELNVSPAFGELLTGLISLQRELHVDFRFRGFVKAELLTADLARGMYQAGFRQVLSGFESGSPRMLANMHKGATVEDNTRCVELLRTAGIRVKALMSIGHPGESPETLAATADWLYDVKPDDFDLTIITVYPGTPYFDDAKLYYNPLGGAPQTYMYKAPNGDRLFATDVDYLRDQAFYKGVPGDYRSFVWTDWVTARELVAARDTIERAVRLALNIPWPSAAAALHFDHSMGQRG